MLKAFDYIGETEINNLAKINIKKNPVIIFAFLTLIAITVTGIVFKQTFIRILPLYISLFVAYLNSQLNRYAPLVGAVNSLLYTVVYLSYKLYATALYAFCCSFVLQLITFIRWSKHPYGKSTVFHRMTGKQRIFVVLLFAVVWTGMFFILRLSGGAYSLLDDTVSLIGILSTVLMLLSFIEYTWLNIPNNVVTLILYIVMLGEHPEQITYVIFSLYSLFCAVLAVFKARAMIKQQNQ